MSRDGRSDLAVSQIAGLRIEFMVVREVVHDRDLAGDVRWGITHGLMWAAAWPLMVAFMLPIQLLRAAPRLDEIENDLTVGGFLEAWGIVTGTFLLIGFVSGLLRPLTKTDLGHFIIGSTVGILFWVGAWTYGVIGDGFVVSWGEVLSLKMLAFVAAFWAIGGVVGAAVYYGNEYGTQSR